jgi:hypothetical protein
LAPVVLCWCLFLLGACKDPIIESTDLLTTDDQLGLGKDTLYPVAVNLFETPFISSGLSTGVLGSMDDPYFGKTYCSVYAQCRLDANNIYFGVNPVLDSAVLTLGYNGKYGKFDAPVQLVAFELAQSMDASASYYTNDAFRVNLPPIGTINNFVPNITDTISVYGVSYPAHLRMRLTNSFGNKILLADSTKLENNTTFLDLFKGFYLTTSPSSLSNGNLYLNMRSSLSKITLYYHNDAADSLKYDIAITSESATVNHFDHNYNGTPLQTSVSNPNPNGEEKLYIQAGVGSKSKITIPNLDSLPKNIAINRAELIFTAEPSQNGFDSVYPPPLLLNLYRIDDAGDSKALEDDGTSHYGGVREYETVNGVALYRYHFNIQKYLQKVVKGIYNNNGLYLQTIAANVNAERVILTNSNPEYKISLLITYTKL